MAKVGFVVGFAGKEIEFMLGSIIIIIMIIALTLIAILAINKGTTLELKAVVPLIKLNLKLKK